MTYLFNESIKVGVFPQILKIGIITPVYKTGDKTDISNYRPICILSTLSKIFEKCVKKIMLQFLLDYKFFSANQYGFLPGKGTDDVLFNHISCITQHLEDGRSVAAVYFDLRKAFDVLDHRILLRKLYACGFRDNVYRWFQSYLQDRKHVTKMGEILSRTIVPSSGVPQGSILGPYLFLIYINDLCNLDISGKIFSYADDTAIVVDSRFPDILQNRTQESVDRVSKWLINNRLVVNPEKTKYLIYSYQAPSIFENMEIYLNNRYALQRAYEIKYLGIMFDCKLIWDKHLIYIIRKIRKLNYLFYYLKQYFSPKHLLRLYIALYQPVLTYGIVHWGGAAEYHLKPLYSLQKSVLRSISNSNLNTPILNVRELYNLNILNFVVKHKDYFEVGIVRGKTRTAGTEKARVPHFNKSQCRMQAIYAGAVAYNLIPESVKTDLVNYKRRRRKTLASYVVSKNC